MDKEQKFRSKITGKIYSLDELLKLSIEQYDIELVQIRKVYRWKHSNAELLPAQVNNRNEYKWEFPMHDIHYIDYNTFQICLSAGLIIGNEEVTKSEAGDE